jgi:DNA-binding winged helix-turn-helix (wHTH) protein/Tol biopolymer transport system component
MSNPEKHFYEFGPFRIDPDQRLLLRGNQPVPLQPKAFETLLVLVQHGQEVVLKDDLMKSVWPDTFVEESNLAQNVFVLRKALGETGSEQRYILTVPGRGYRFVQKVRTVPAVEEVEDLVVESHSRSRVVIEQEPWAARAPVVMTERRRIRRSVLLVAVGVALMALVFRPSVPPPKVTRILQITHLGSVAENNLLLTDGPRIYFRALDTKGRDGPIYYVSPQGGEVFPVEKPFLSMDMDDISPNGSEFLIVDYGSGDLGRDLHTVWRVPAPSGSPQPVGKVLTRSARWSPDGRTIAYTVDSDLYLANADGSNPRKVAGSPGEPIYLQWSPNGKHLRFSVVDHEGAGRTLWQADFPANTIRRLLPDWSASRRLLAGGWAPDGRYFFYTALSDETRNIWAIREQQGWRRVNSRPVQLTAGPLDFYQPTPGKDGKSVFAVGEQSRGQLLRYDAASRQFVPYAQGISADQVAFAKDGQWMAYVEYPGRVLVRSRVDGSNRRQLTFPPMRVSNPQWSPDGLQLAIQASTELGAPPKVYLASRDGGTPALATPERHDRQVYPSWSFQRNSIAFSSFDETGSNPALWTLDLKSRSVSLLPGTAGLWDGQVSPDGRQVAALEGEPSTGGPRKLMLYDMLSHNVRTLAESADYPRWSTDGKYVYFRTLYYSLLPIENPGVYRWRASTNTIEKVLGSTDFPLVGLDGVWSGLTPDGAPLLLRDLSTRDICRLDVELP